MPPVSSSISLRALALGGAVAVCATTPAFAQNEPPAEQQPVPPAAQEPPADRGAEEDPAREPARINLKLKDVEGNKIDVGRRYKAIGKVFPWVPRQKVTVLLKRDSKVILRRKVAIERIRGRDAGRFELTSKPIIKPGTYRFRANKNETTTQEGALAGSRGVRVDYPDLDPGDDGRAVKIFNDLLARQAYYTARGRSYGSATSRAVLAYRKVNNMPRTGNATPGIFETLAAGEGGFKLKWPEGGKHIETDLSRQVMVLAKNGKPKHIFHISSGASATPTVRGKYATYRKDYGTNNLGMVHSVYFHRGYATHGYRSVPTYPASHGCLRNPIPNAKFIYNWINLGDVFYVYG
jgi:hypothetical protein